MSSPALEIRDLSKRYRLGGPRNAQATLGEALQRLAGRVLGRSRGRANGDAAGADEKTFWALRDISFDVREGEVLGLIGRNGAGKSTLLKILSRITDPTAGWAKVRGRIGSLLEVGTGFHPELTGRENIFLNGAILGMRRPEIRRKFDDIVAFSGIDKFLDTPVKRYSSGMYVRLAFAVAAHLEPEVLLIDEVLAVGDIAFQQRCLGKMKEVAGSGRTVIFVSHNLKAVRALCDRVAWLENGQLRGVGDAEPIVEQYLHDGANPTWDHLDQQIADLPADPAFRLVAVAMEQNGRSVTEPAIDRPLQLALTYDVLQPTVGLRVYFDLCDQDDDILVRSFHDEWCGQVTTAQPGRHTVVASLPAHLLAPRLYTLIVKAGIHNVRSCLSQGLRLPLHPQAAGAWNQAYPGDPVRSKLLPRIQWTQHPVEVSTCPVLRQVA